MNASKFSFRELWREPTFGSLLARCAYALNGNIAAATPTSVMKSRRRMCPPKGLRFLQYKIITGYDPAASQKWHTTNLRCQSGLMVRFGSFATEASSPNVRYASNSEKI